VKGIDGHGRDGAEGLRELEGEENLRQRALRVGAELLIVALEHDVVEVDRLLADQIEATLTIRADSERRSSGRRSPVSRKPAR